MRVNEVRGVVCGLVVSALASGAPAFAQAVAGPKQGEESGASRLESLLARRPVVKQALTLEQAVAIALRESPVVRGAREEVEAANGRLRAARAETRPWLSLNTFASGGSNANIVASPTVVQPQMITALPRDAFLDQNLMLMFPLSTGGRLGAMTRQAAALRDASSSDVLTQQQEVALLTRMAYREVSARQALITVARSRLTDTRERLRVDQNRFQQGVVPALTVRRDEAEVAAAEQEETNAVRDTQLASVQLKTVMGVHPGSEITLTEGNDYRPSTEFLAPLMALTPSRAASPPPGSGDLPPDLAALLRLALRRRPELQAGDERIRAARADTSAVKSAFQPQVNLFAMGDLTTGHAARGFAGTTFGLTASLPLYNGGERRAHVKTSEAERRKQETEQERLGLQVVQEVSNALLNLRAAERNIQTARTAQTAAQEGYRVALERYKAGRSLLVELQDALTSRTQAESNVVQALFQYNVACDTLLRATGTLK